MAFEKGVGIHLLNRQILIAQRSRGGEVELLLQKELPEGVVSDTIVKRPELLKSRIDALLQTKELARLKGNIALIVPDSRVFVATFVVSAKMKRKDVEAEVVKRAQRQIPVPFKNAAVDMEFGATIQGKQTVSVFAVERDVADALKQAAEFFSMPVVVMEDGNTAVLRVLEDALESDVRDTHAKMVVDVGSAWLNISLFNAGGLAISARSFKFPSEVVRSKTEKGKLSAMHVTLICDNMRETVTFYKGVDGGHVSAFLTGVGGGSKELLAACKKALKGYSVSRVSDIISLPDVTPAQLHIFCAAIGAADRAAHPRKFNSIHNFKDAISYDG